MDNLDSLSAWSTILPSWVHSLRMTTSSSFQEKETMCWRGFKCQARLCTVPTSLDTIILNQLLDFYQCISTLTITTSNNVLLSANNFRSSSRETLVDESWLKPCVALPIYASWRDTSLSIFSFHNNKNDQHWWYSIEIHINRGWRSIWTFPPNFLILNFKKNVDLSVSSYLLNISITRLTLLTCARFQHILTNKIALHWSCMQGMYYVHTSCTWYFARAWHFRTAAKCHIGQMA